MKNYLFLFLCFLSACRPEAVAPESLEEAVVSSVSPYIHFGALSSVSVGILANGNRQTFHYGYAFPEEKIRPSDTTLYALGDLTQVFTATLIADLILEGKVRLNDSIDRHLPVVAPDFGSEKITVGQILTHTSGLPFEVASDYLRLSPLEQATVYKDFSQADFPMFLNGISLPGLPGERYHYSRAGMGILGYTLEEVSGQNWSDFLEERITGPLGMSDTRNLDRMNTQQFGRLGEARSTTQNPLIHYQWGEYRGAASLYGTTDDLLRFLAAELNPFSVISDAFAFTRVSQFELGAGNSVGSGWLISEKDGSLLYFWSGEAAHAGFMAFDYENQFAVVVLAGTPQAESVETIGWAIMDFLHNQ
ncbi:MAG: serine hydrolase domain-containing protein [Bacteroidia bacterium]|nr:serine hydrolase domain-containing protein [Bacteroidia bacterium]